MDCDFYGDQDLDNAEFFHADAKPIIIQPLKIPKVRKNFLH